MSVKPVPEGFHTLTPYLIVESAADLLEFLSRAFGAEEIEKMTLPDGTVMHAQVRIGDSMLMMGTAREEWPAMPGFLHLYVEDADAYYARALAAGATSVQEPKDEFHGDRTSGARDPQGNLWWFATHQEAVPPEEMARRAQAHVAE